DVYTRQPVYILFYNGKGMDTDSLMLYLSDSFSAGRGSGMDRKEAVETAMDVCIEKGILKDILIREKAEVMHMLLTEYDEKKHLRNTYREGKEEGIKEGMELGLNRGREEGREEKLRELVQKKLSRGKTIPEIAEELEEAPLIIEQIVSSIISR
ncbi:MAG: hypothetical protein K2M20_04640, partial [Lachnospiraceae bacterium]|nr:hypothetical protein [Lachnospiraceae bacterium]